jgi:hypothetical protein
MKMGRRRRRAEPGLTGIRPIQDGFRLSEEINPWWLWLAGVASALLVVLAILLDLLWKVKNILPSVTLDLGIGSILFALLFLLQRRIVRRTSILWVSALEEMAARSGQDPDQLAAHFGGPVAVVHEFVDAILGEGDCRRAWRFADPIWRLCRAQAWLWNNLSHPLVSKFDRDTAAGALAEVDSTHELWQAFAQSELEQFSEAWSGPDLRTHGAASATRKVEDGEIVLLVDLSEHPDGAMVHAPTPVRGTPFLVRKIADAWQIANLVGDHIPEPGWPPNWKEGWTYWEKLFEADG